MVRNRSTVCSVLLVGTAFLMVFCLTEGAATTEPTTNTNETTTNATTTTSTNGANTSTTKSAPTTTMTSVPSYGAATTKPTTTTKETTTNATTTTSTNGANTSTTNTAPTTTTTSVPSYDPRYNLVVILQAVSTGILVILTAVVICGGVFFWRHRHNDRHWTPSNSVQCVYVPPNSEPPSSEIQDNLGTKEDDISVNLEEINEENYDVVGDISPGNNYVCLNDRTGHTDLYASPRHPLTLPTPAALSKEADNTAPDLKKEVGKRKELMEKKEKEEEEKEEREEEEKEVKEEEKKKKKKEEKKKEVMEKKEREEEEKEEEKVKEVEEKEDEVKEEKEKEEEEKEKKKKKKKKKKDEGEEDGSDQMELVERSAESPSHVYGNQLLVMEEEQEEEEALYENWSPSFGFY